ncbi:MAG: hypothetical protein ACTS4V_01525 [Candidatus Hodgkinia cicadicola]
MKDITNTTKIKKNKQLRVSLAAAASKANEHGSERELSSEAEWPPEVPLPESKGDLARSPEAHVPLPVSGGQIPKTPDELNSRESEFLKYVAGLKIDKSVKDRILSEYSMVLLACGA